MGGAAGFLLISEIPVEGEMAPGGLSIWVRCPQVGRIRLDGAKQVGMITPPAAGCSVLDSNY